MGTAVPRLHGGRELGPLALTSRLRQEVTDKPNLLFALLVFDVTDAVPDSPPRSRPPRVDIPKFDGENPKLWQIRCEDYFDLYETSPRIWVRLAAMQFTGPAARWLSSIHSSLRKFTWSEFCHEVVHRFGRNQHQSLIRRLYKLTQTGTVDEYVTQFSELVDQLSAYESSTDPLHYVTRFLEGLKPHVRLLVAVQLPQDLDTAYTIALVQEEVGDGVTTLNATSVPRRHMQHQTAARIEDKMLSATVTPREPARLDDDKLTVLKNYRRAKGLCFTCGERWSRDHKCKATVQLHVVQEMVDFFQYPENYLTEQVETTDDMELMHLSADANLDAPPEKSIILHCQVQGHPATFLLDSGSNNSFISAKLAAQVSGHQDPPQPKCVKVAGGGILQCKSHIPNCKWTCGNTEFCSSFKILPLQNYDGIVGMD